ncbi:MAG TPA: hypothetical protein VJT09_11695 [Pyrinomonadaceae bacterium]|nr:hypothetical protein [Pyrinomonadaceae bacterium]
MKICDFSRRISAPLPARFLLLLLAILLPSIPSPQVTGQTPPVQNTNAPLRLSEYLWYEAENMRGISTNERHEPVANPSWINPPKEKAPGWGINGPGVSAEWTQGGESEWNSVAASADETRAIIYQDVEVPRAGQYKFWVRYADWARRTENFTVRITQEGREVFKHEFGAREVIDSHDEVSMYWGWAFAWDGAAATLSKGPARVSIEVEKAAEARRHVDCFVLTNDPVFVPEGRRKPDFAAMRYLREWSAARTELAPLIEPAAGIDVPALWRRKPIAGRDFLMPWNIAKEFWKLYDATPPEERPLYPFHAEPIEEFVKKYKGARDVPIFNSKLIVPVIYINDMPEYLTEGSPFVRYLRETKQPFAILINYGSFNWKEGEVEARAQAAWKLLTTDFRDQFLGWISGESVGYVWADAATELKLTPQMSRRELLEAHRVFYTRALERKWSTIFHTPQTGPMWDKLIPAQSTSSTSFAHALGEWGTRLIGIETAAVQPVTAMRIAFTRGAARQYGGNFLYYHAPNFGDTATTFTIAQNFAGPNNFWHSRYGVTMGPSLSWYRKSYYLYYMAGASAIYLEQGHDQFFKPGPGEHPFQLNPLGHITDEFMRFAEKHPERGTPYTPIAFLLDPAHGWDMTDYPQWPFGVSQIDRSDRALRELFGAAYYPAPVTEGEPATADRQVYVASPFGDIFDVLVASETRADAIDAYRAAIVGGRIEWSRAWAKRLEDYVRKGGVLVINAAQVKGLTEELLGVRLLGERAEADDARCLAPNEAAADLRGQMFRYERVEARKGVQVLMETATKEPLVTVNKVGQGSVIFVALPDLLGEDERLTPFAAHLLAHLSSDATPVRVRGEVEYLINRTERGWVVTLINGKGVLKPQQGMAQVDRSASAEVTLTLRGKGIEQAREWIDDRPLDISRANGEGSVKLTIAPGSVNIVELTVSSGQWSVVSGQ